MHEFMNVMFLYVGSPYTGRLPQNLQSFNKFQKRKHRKGRVFLWSHLNYSLESAGKLKHKPEIYFSMGEI
jgi:hypothetical protein